MFAPSPLGHQQLRDLHVDVHHAVCCLGCCWALFVALVALGVLNVAGMVTLAAVVVVEKLTPVGHVTGPDAHLVTIRLVRSEP